MGLEAGELVRCSNVYDLSVERFCSGPLWISAHVLGWLPDRPLMAIMAHSLLNVTGRPFVHLLGSSRRTRREDRLFSYVISTVLREAILLEPLSRACQFRRTSMVERDSGGSPRGSEQALFNQHVHISGIDTSGHAPAHSRRYAPICWRAQQPERCDAIVWMRLQSSP